MEQFTINCPNRLEKAVIRLEKMAMMHFFVSIPGGLLRIAVKKPLTAI